MPENNYTKRQIVKTPATITAQLEKIRERGCIIEDESHAREVLSTINYYRLVHYFAVFLENKHKYKDGTSFEKVLRLYDFDRVLRNELLVVLEEIEITMRAIISNYHALKYGALGYLNSSSFDRHHKHPQFLSKIERMIETNGDISMVKHHKNKYSGSFPLWVIMELFSFGTLVFFYQDMYEKDKKEIVSENFSYLGIDNRHMDSWLSSLSELRNSAAHYNRLYGNPFRAEDKPRKFENAPFEMNNTLFDRVYIMKCLTKRCETWNNVFLERLQKVFTDYKDIIDLNILGFPENWKEILIIE